MHVEGSNRLLTLCARLDQGLMSNGVTKSVSMNFVDRNIVTMEKNLRLSETEEQF